MQEYSEGRGKRRSIAVMVWLATILILIGPSLLVWAVRGIAYAAKCAPGPDMCRALPIGEAFRIALAIAWALPTNSFPLIAVAVLATIAGFFAHRPLVAASGLLILPVASLLLPMFAVFSAIYPGCSVNEAGVGECPLWGSNMGMSFHQAATVQWQIYGFAPYSFALALMLGLLGWFFAQPRPARPHAMAHMRRIDR
jgi:hypothetical protein